MLVVTVALLSGAAAAAVTIATLSPNSIAPASGTLQGDADLSVDSQELTYQGTNVTSTDVTVSNAGSASATIDVHVALKTSSGGLVESTTLASKSVASSSTATFTVSFSSNPGVDEFADVEVTVERTA